jgi:ABC-2 type transport system permease protein
MHRRLIVIIAKQELKSIFRDKTSWILYTILVVISLIAVYTGWSYVRQFNDQQLAAKEEVSNHWMNQPERHPHRVAHYGYLIFREKSALSFFDYGLDSYVGNSVFLEAHRQNTVNMSEAGFSNGMLRFGELSMAMVLQMLVPLFIVFIGFHTVSGLKQSGVLKILLCQKASYFDILMGKAIGLTLVSWVLFLPLVLLSLFCGVLSLAGDLTADIVLRSLLVVLVYAGYLLVIVLLVVGVSAVSNSVRSSLMTLVLFWILFCVIVPKSAQTIGSRLFSAPDKIAFEHAIEEEISKEGDSHDPDDPHFAKLKKDVLLKYGVDSISQLPINYGALVMQEGENISSGIFSSHYDRLISIYKSQNAVSSLLSLIDPYLAIRNISMNLAGTDFETFTEFQIQTEKYRFEKTRNINEIHLTQIKFKNDRNQKVSSKNWQQQPEFIFKPVSIQTNMANSATSFAGLLFWIVAGIGALKYVSTKPEYQ